ncbi:MAG TPA: hypothetical protein VL947_10540 [Cytophagales bacterium]|nr:hypothetical protein [Cytophagales bacterium]
MTLETITYQGADLEVLLMANDTWNYLLYKDPMQHTYYFDIMVNMSAAYWNVLLLVSPDLVPRLKEAISTNNKSEIEGYSQAP